ncbi:MAG: hypothetical protein M1819_003214 [Sarea resinae]|nr:MAG: hypothetical protein M1819_003214 [Sarea resinae]
MPRLVRRRPLIERVKAYLNPLDFLLWLSEEIDSKDWEDFSRDYALPVGTALNLIFIVARANSGNSGSRKGSDDVFGDEGGRGGGWLSWLAAFIVHFLILLSLLNAFYTFYRKRHYRLFEAPIDVAPTTPSAHRTPVDSSPLSSSPLRFLSNIIANSSASANARSHPDATRDVWELAVWDPTPICLRMFCLLSPAHIVVYCLLLPTAPYDPRPSVTVVTAISLAILLSAQLMMLQQSFSQQTKDTALIHKEVLNEYDTKFVHPRLTPQVRDVGIQCTTRYRSTGTGAGDDDVEDDGEIEDEIDTYTPTTIINRGFHTNPNPNYARYADPDGVDRSTYTSARNTSFSSSSSSAATGTNPTFQTPVHRREASTPIRPRTAVRQPQFASSSTGLGSGPGPGLGDGGSLGVYSHANSPLKRSATASYLISGSNPNHASHENHGPHGGGGGGGGAGGLRHSTSQQSFPQSRNWLRNAEYSQENSRNGTPGVRRERSNSGGGGGGASGLLKQRSGVSGGGGGYPSGSTPLRRQTGRYY